MIFNIIVTDISSDNECSIAFLYGRFNIEQERAYTADTVLNITPSINNIYFTTPGGIDFKVNYIVGNVSNYNYIIQSDIKEYYRIINEI